MDSNRNSVKKVRVVFYGRVSTEHEAQVDALTNQMQWYDDQLKYYKNWVCVGKYIDKGITGTQAKKRPEFLRMLNDAKLDKFDLIATREVCRFARNTVETLSITRDLVHYNVEVCFLEDNIWTMDGDSELRLSLMATLAQEEARKISERVKAGQKISIENGTLYGNGNILGYDRVDGTYVINPEQAETVRIIYNAYLNGMGCKKIVTLLYKLQRKCANGDVKWSVSKVNRILRNATYKGYICSNKSHVNNFLEQKRINNLDESTYVYRQGDFPYIIHYDEWDKVQEIRRSKSIKVNIDGKNRIQGKKKAQDVWLRKLVCSCGSTFRKNKWRTNKNGENAYGYQCYKQVNYGSKQYREKHNLSTDGACNMKMIADWKLELMAKTVFENVWADRKKDVIMAYNMIAEAYCEENTTLSNSELTKKKNEIKKLETKLDRIIEMRAEGEISKEEYQRMRVKFDSQITSLKEEINKNSCIVTNHNDIMKKMGTIEDKLNEYIDFSTNISEDVIEKFVSQIVAVTDSKFCWKLNFFDGDDFTTGISGNKRKPNIINYENSLPMVQCSTGSTE